MLYNAKNCTIELDGTNMDYITFGNGSKNLVIIPGLGDAFKGVYGTAFLFSLMYRIFARDYTVYVFSRKHKLPQNYSIIEMAADLAKILNKLNITKTYVLGISQGGMIAQYLAINNPNLVKKLVLTVTICKTNTTVSNVLHKWLEFAKKDDFKSIFIDTAEKTYSENKLKRIRLFYPLLVKFAAPKSLYRFIVQANACLKHNSSEELSKIICPTFIIGGSADRIVGPNSSEEIAKLIPNSKIKIYEGLGHNTYDDAKDFKHVVFDFLQS